MFGVQRERVGSETLSLALVVGGLIVRPLHLLSDHLLLIPLSSPAFNFLNLSLVNSCGSKDCLLTYNPILSNHSRSASVR